MVRNVDVLMAFIKCPEITDVLRSTCMCLCMFVYVREEKLSFAGRN